MALETIRLNQTRECPGCKSNVNPFLKTLTVQHNMATAICPTCETEFRTPVNVCPVCGNSGHGLGWHDV